MPRQSPTDAEKVPQIQPVRAAIGYRFYRLTGDGHLESPFAGIPLPDNGIDVAECCTRLMCEHGLSFYRLEQMQQATKVFELPNESHVIVLGEVGGRVRPDPRVQVYTDLDGRVMGGPESLRCDRFTALAILASTPLTLVYDVPVIVGKDLKELLPT